MASSRRTEPERPKLTFGTHFICPSCKGRGAKNSQICAQCQGKGVITKEQM